MTFPTGRPSRKNHSVRRRRYGFTLIEILLVVVIVLIASGVAVPSFIRSYRGAKLRASARTVVMMHRHARSLAVLQQKPMTLLADAKNAQWEVVSVTSDAADGAVNRFLAGRDMPVLAVNTNVETNITATVSSELSRALEPGVTVADFHGGTTMTDKDDVHLVTYQVNGMCDPYAVTLRDEREQTTSIVVDGLSGKAEVTYEK